MLLHYGYLIFWIEYLRVVRYVYTLAIVDHCDHGGLVLGLWLIDRAKAGVESFGLVALSFEALFHRVFAARRFASVQVSTTMAIVGVVD